MEKKPNKPNNQTEQDQENDSSEAYKKWKDEDKNKMGNDISSEIKIANADGKLEGGDNKQWHMDQGNFAEEEKEDFENEQEK